MSSVEPCEARLPYILAVLVQFQCSYRKVLIIAKGIDITRSEYDNALTLTLRLKW